MREINPRHAVPEGDMTKRNPVLKALADDTVLDPLGKLEVELAYLLRSGRPGHRAAPCERSAERRGGCAVRTPDPLWKSKVSESPPSSATGSRSPS